MSRPIRIADLEDDIRWQADKERATLRHTSPKLRRAINQSIQNFRLKIANSGDPLFLSSYTLKTPVGRAVSPQNDSVKFGWGELDLSELNPKAVQIYGVHIHYNGLTTSLHAVSFAEINDYDVRGALGFPSSFSTYDKTKLALLPAADRAYDITIWYVPLLPQLSADDDEFDPVIPGGDEWVMWDVMVKLLNRDNYPDQYGMAVTERDKRMREIMHEAHRNQRVSPKHRLDTRSRRTRNARRLLLWGSRQ